MQVDGRRPADDLERPTPCERWNVTQVLQHAVGDQLAFAAAIDGGPGPAEDPFAPSGRVDGDELAGLRAALDASARAWNGVADDDPAVPTPLPRGSCRPRSAPWRAPWMRQCTPGTSRWPPTNRPRSAPNWPAPCWWWPGSIVEPLRAYGAYAPAIDPAPEADEVAALLSYLGRNPR